MTVASSEPGLAVGPNCSAVLVVLQSNARIAFPCGWNSFFRKRPVASRLSAVGDTVGPGILPVDPLICIAAEPEALLRFWVFISTRISRSGLFCRMTIRPAERFHGD